MPRSAKGKRWTFTLNNPELDADAMHEKFAEKGYKYLVFQKEVGDNDTPHYQGTKPV